MEFQAVVFCGPGKRLNPITTGICKALLPVGNKPLIQYAIEWCSKAGFAGTIIAVHEDDYKDIEAACHAFELKVRLFKIPQGTSSGRVLQLLKVADGALHPQRDLAVLPCDFLTDIDPETLISTVRSQDDNTAVIGFYYRNTFETLDLKTLDPDVLLHSADNAYTATGRSCLLLDSYERSKVKEAKKLQPRMAMLWKFPQVVATMDLLGSAIYFMSRHVLAFEDINFEQPIVKVVRDIGRRTWRHRGFKETVVMQQLIPPALNSSPMSSQANPPTKLKQQQQPVLPLFLRANNLPAYMEANRHFLRQKARFHQDNDNSKREPSQAMIGNDSLVGVNTTVGERSSVKRTSIGRNCVIGKKCRLNGCVILDDATIGNDVMLENCIIGKGSTIEAKSKLVGCSVESGYTVASETDAKNEVLKGLSMTNDDEFSAMYESLSEDSTDEEDDTEEEESDQDDDDDLFDRD